MRRIVISGCGRSGTAYFAQVLQLCGIRCGHEIVFGPHGFHWGDYEADSSWLAAPYLASQHEVFVVHLVRSPLLVLRSSATFFRKDDEVYHEAIRRARPSIFETQDPFERFVRYWVQWNDLIVDRADMRIRIEDVSEFTIDRILRQSNRVVEWKTLANAIASVPRDLNKHIVEDAWAKTRAVQDLTRTESFSRLDRQARRLGYQIDAQGVTLTEIRCPFCTGRCAVEFEARVRARYTAAYATCLTCGSLHIVDPHWLEEAHRDLSLGGKVDSGAEWRNLTLARLLVILAPLTRAGPWLDYGSGSGLLVAALLKHGYDVVGYDPYRGSNLEFGKRFTVVGCFEVLEHQKDPVQFMRAMSATLADDGVIIMSTWLREPCHGKGWSYLAREAGQHCAFPSRAGFAALCKASGLVWRLSAASRENESLQIHVLARSQTDSPHLLRSALAQAGFDLINV